MKFMPGPTVDISLTQEALGVVSCVSGSGPDD